MRIFNKSPNIISAIFALIYGVREKFVHQEKMCPGDTFPRKFCPTLRQSQNQCWQISHLGPVLQKLVPHKRSRVEKLVPGPILAAKIGPLNWFWQKKLVPLVKNSPPCKTESLHPCVLILYTTTFISLQTSMQNYNHAGSLYRVNWQCIAIMSGALVLAVSLAKNGLPCKTESLH